MRRSAPLIAFVALVSPLLAQGYREYRSPSFRDFELVRARPVPWEKGLVVRGGLAGNVPSKEDADLGLESINSFDGFAWYRDDHIGDRDAQVDLYAGRDGVIATIRDGRPEENGGRLELSSRFFPFWREGFYRGDDYIPTGRYEGRDYGAYLGLNAPLAEGISGEIGPFWRSYSFERNVDTSDSYTIPEDFNAFGGRAHVQHSTIEFHRRTGRVINGFLFGARVEYERNGANDPFGTALWTSTLPKAFWRGNGHLEWYFPTEGGNVWEWQVDGSMSDRSDRIHNYDASKPAGHLWVDSSLGYRLDFGELAITPFGRGQYTTTADESGAGDKTNLWFGGGLRMDWLLGDTITLLADYSYLNNPNRPSVAFDRDAAGEHQFFIGLEVRIGTPGR